MCKSYQKKKRAKMGTKSTREYKIRWLRQNIHSFFQKSPSQSISKKKLLAQFALSTMSTKRTGEEILETLSDAGEIEVKGDDILKPKK